MDEVAFVQIGEGKTYKFSNQYFHKPAQQEGSPLIENNQLEAMIHQVVTYTEEYDISFDHLVQ